MKKKILSFIVSGIVLCSVLNVYAADIKLSVNGNNFEFEKSLGTPFIDENSRTLLPLRSAAHAIGIDDEFVVWNDEEKSAEFIRLDEYGEVKSAKFTLSSIECVVKDGVNEEIVKMDTEAVIKDGRVYAPIRYLAEGFGYKVDWIGEESRVLLTSEVEEAEEAEPKAEKKETVDISKFEVSPEEAENYLYLIFGYENVESELSVVYNYEDVLSFNDEYYYRFNVYEIVDGTAENTGLIYVKTDGSEVTDGYMEDDRFVMNVYDTDGNLSEVFSD